MFKHTCAEKLLCISMFKHTHAEKLVCISMFKHTCAGKLLCISMFKHTHTKHILGRISSNMNGEISYRILTICVIIEFLSGENVYEIPFLILEAIYENVLINSYESKKKASAILIIFRNENLKKRRKSTFLYIFLFVFLKVMYLWDGTGVGGEDISSQFRFWDRFLSEPEAHCWLGRLLSEFRDLLSPPGNARVSGMHGYTWLSSGCWRFKLRSLCATQPSLRLVGTQ